jgi:DNA-binding LacI/PurR family transcriptional regulator
LAIISLERDKLDGETYTQLLMRKGVRGAILRTDTHSRHVCEAIAAEGFPSVVVAERFDSPRVNYIYTDSGPDSRRAVDHLIHLGHQRIAFVMNHVPDHDHADRFDAYRAALSAAEIAYDPELCVKAPAHLPGGKSALNRLLSLPHPPTAVYFADPLACVGAMTRAHELGVRIPDELSVVGFDDADIRFRVWPTLTAVCQDASQLGFEAALWLTRKVTGASGEFADESAECRENGSLHRQAATFFDVHGTTGRPPSQVFRILPDGSRLAAEGNSSSSHPSSPQRKLRKL